MFWQITPREVAVILDGADARDRAMMRMNQAMAWSTAQLVAVGFNNPKDFPKFEKYFPDPEARRNPQSPDEIWEAMSTWAEVARITHENAAKEVS